MRVLLAMLCLLVATPAVAANKPVKKRYKAKASGEVLRVAREKPKEDPKAKKEKDAPKVVEKRRSREKSNIDDIDDEIDILRELLDIERGSPSEADTLLELSYVLWDRAEAYEGEAYDSYYTVGMHEAEKSKNRKEQHRLRIEQQNLLEQARGTKNEVIDNLKRIERRFSRFSKLGEVLYALGFHLNEMERHGEAVDAFFRLVRKIPKSPFIPDAYLGIGNYYFGKNQGGEALKWYRKTLAFKKSNTYGWALYYIAWVEYNQQAYKKAVTAFVDVLDYSANEAKGRITFFEDGRKYLVRSWAEFGKPDEAMPFFEKVVPGQEIELMDALVRYYIEASEYDKSNRVLTDLIAATDSMPRVVEYYYLRVDNFYKQSDLDKVKTSVEDLARALRRHGLSGVKSADIPLLLAEIASTFHAESERTLEKNRLAAAENVYRTYLEHFSNHVHAYDMLHNHALALFQLERWKEAAESYEKVIEMKPKGKYAEPSAHRSLISYLKMQDLNPGSGTKNEDQLLNEMEFADETARIVRACERFLKIAKAQNKKDDVPEAQFVLARMYYQHNRFEDAGKHFADFVNSFTTHALSLDAARLMMSSFYLGQDGNNLNKWADLLLEDGRYKSLLTADAANNKGVFQKTLVEIKENKEYNLCLTRKDRPRDAAKCLLDYAKAYPTSSQALRAYAGAARFYRTARDKDEVIETYYKLAKDHPEDPRAQQALLEIADVHRETADFSKAAAAYEELVEKYPSSNEAMKALTRANQIREALGQYDKLVANAERFIKYFGKDKDAVNQGFKLTVQYVRKKDWRGVVRVTDKFLKKSKDLPIHLRLAAQANAALAWIHISRGDTKARKYTEDILAVAANMATDGTFKDLPQTGKNAVAQALFVQGEILFNEMLRMKVKARKLADAVKLAKNKSIAAKKAEKFYIEVENSKNPKWTAAAASRRGRSMHEIAKALEGLPAPKAMRRVEDLRLEWEARMSEKAEPFKTQARTLYKDALKKAAAVFAFDEYWEEARDQLKTLDQEFAAIVEMPEHTIELSTVGWSYPKESPKKAISALRYDLFNRPVQAAGVTGAGEKAGPAPYDHGAAYLKLATAHHILGQHPEALMVAAVGMTLSPALKTDAHLLTMMGLSELAVGNTQRGLVRFKQAAAVDKTATTPLLNIATMQLKKLDLEAAAKLLREVIARDQANYMARVALPVALRRLQKGGEALALLDELVKQHPTRPEGHYNRCVIAQAVLGATNKRVDVERAVKACEEAYEAHSKRSPNRPKLKKRVDGLKGTLEFMEPEPAPGAAAPGGAAGGADAAPADAKPADAKPADATPADAKPDDAAK